MCTNVHLWPKRWHHPVRKSVVALLSLLKNPRLAGGFMKQDVTLQRKNIKHHKLKQIEWWNASTYHSASKMSELWNLERYLKSTWHSCYALCLNLPLEGCPGVAVILLMDWIMHQLKYIYNHIYICMKPQQKIGDSPMSTGAGFLVSTL